MRKQKINKCDKFLFVRQSIRNICVDYALVKIEAIDSGTQSNVTVSNITAVHAYAENGAYLVRNLNKFIKYTLNFYVTD